MRYQADGTFAPGLATKVASPTPTNFVYTIRQGVKFWDGTPLTADDVTRLSAIQSGADGAIYDIPLSQLKSYQSISDFSIADAPRTSRSTSSTSWPDRTAASAGVANIPSAGQSPALANASTKDGQ
jgi:hypothetical protein